MFFDFKWIVDDSLNTPFREAHSSQPLPTSSKLKLLEACTLLLKHWLSTALAPVLASLSSRYLKVEGRKNIWNMIFLGPGDVY